MSQNTTILDESLVFNITLSNSEIDYDYLKKLLFKLNLNRFINPNGEIDNVNIGDKVQEFQVEKTKNRLM